jgi:2-methylcitrate synthase
MSTSAAFIPPRSAVFAAAATAARLLRFVWVGLFPPMFLLARVCGLIAHISEQRANNRIIHPSSSYIGPAQRPYSARARATRN